MSFAQAIRDVPCEEPGSFFCSSPTPDAKVAGSTVAGCGERQGTEGGRDRTVQKNRAPPIIRR